MTGFHFVIIFGLTFVLISCKGQIISPPDGTKLTFLPGSSENITWNYVEDPSDFADRRWYFTSTDGSSRLIAQIIDGFGLQVRKDFLASIAITQPATLSLNNVNQSFDGTYLFNLKIGSQPDVTYNVRVYIAKKPNVRINCSSPTTVNEGDDVICLCRGEGGNPPANVTWSKDDVQIGGIGTENKTLILDSANETHSGIYKCKAQSYDHPDYIDEKNITLVVKPKSKPRNTTMKIEPSQTNVGEPVVITCFSEGVPDPHFIITHNDTNFTTTDNPYRIDKVQKSQGGTYTCIAINELGRDFAAGKLNVTGAIPSTPTPTATSTPTPTTTTSTSSGNETVTSTTKPPPSSSSLPIWLIVLIVVIILLILLIIGIVVYRYKMKQKAMGSRGNIDPVAGNHYELENEDAAPGDNAYDSVGPVGTSSGKSKPPEKNTLPPVYAAVDKNNRQGNTLYASLDTDAMKPKRESKKEPERTPQTEYASIDFAKRADDNVPKADLV